MSLLQRLDNALAKQGVTPEDAFKKADTDSNGVVIVSELKSALEFFLPGEEIKPADLKMMMIALDTNKNGRIEQSEFVIAFGKARASAKDEAQLSLLKKLE